MEQDHSPVARALGGEVEQLVLLLEHQLARAPEDVAEELVAAFRHSILGGEEQRLVVLRPCDVAHPLDAVGKERAGAEVLDVQHVLPVAGAVGGVREQVAVVARHDGPDRHELEAGGEHVQVEENLFRCFEVAHPPAQDGVLLSLLGDVPHHLLVEPALKLGRRGHPRGGVGVLGLEMRQDFGARLLPQPEVVVAQRVTVDDGDLGLLRGHGRRQGQGSSGGLGHRRGAAPRNERGGGEEGDREGADGSHGGRLPR